MDGKKRFRDPVDSRTLGHRVVCARLLAHHGPMHIVVPVSFACHPHTPLPALIDSGAYHCFISSDVVKTLGLRTEPLRQQMTLELFDGTTMSAGPITRKVRTPVRIANNNPSPISFLVTRLPPDFPVVLGLSWLRASRPAIDWATGAVTFPTTLGGDRMPTRPPPTPLATLRHSTTDHPSAPAQPRTALPSCSAPHPPTPRSGPESH